MREGLGGLAGILTGLAQGIVQMDPVVVGQGRHLGHAGDGRVLGGGELHHLEVGQAPVGFAEAGCQGDAPAIGRHRVLLAAHGAEGMAVVQPDLRLAAIGDQKVFVDPVDGLVIADQGETRRLEVAVGGIVRRLFQQPVDLGQALRRLLLQEQGVGQVETDGGTAGIGLEDVGEQHLGVGPSSLPQIDVAQHRQGVGIAGPLQQVSAQPCLRRVQPAMADIEGGGFQVRDRHGRPGEFQKGVFRPGGVALEEQEVAQGPPGLRQIGIEGQGQAQGLGGGIQSPQGPLDRPQLVLGVRGPGPGLGEGRDDRERGLGLALSAERRAQDQQQARVLRGPLQQAPGILFRSGRVGGQPRRGGDHMGGKGVLRCARLTHVRISTAGRRGPALKMTAAAVRPREQVGDPPLPRPIGRRSVIARGRPGFSRPSGPAAGSRVLPVAGSYQLKVIRP